MDRFHLLTTFVAVVDTGGFAAAARQTGLSPAAVTRAVAELEAQLGLRLLARTTRVVRVTEAGARYADDARRILVALAEADASVRGLHAAPRGRVVLTAPALFGALHVTPVVTAYLQRYPETSVNALFLDRVVNLMDEGVDMAVRIGELPDSSLQAVRVGQVRRVICAAPDYLACAGTPRQADDLLQHTVIAASSVTPTQDWRLHDGERVHSVKLQPRLSTTSNDAARAAALAGFGLTRLLSYQVAEALQQGRLVAVLPQLEPEPLPVHVVHHAGRHPAQRVRALLDMAVDGLRANPALR